MKRNKSKSSRRTVRSRSRTRKIGQVEGSKAQKLCPHPELRRVGDLCGLCGAAVKD